MRFTAAPAGKRRNSHIAGVERRAALELVEDFAIPTVLILAGTSHSQVRLRSKSHRQLHMRSGYYPGQYMRVPRRRCSRTSFGVMLLLFGCLLTPSAAQVDR